jgi:CRP/FNR family transcriptional regulator
MLEESTTALDAARQWMLTLGRKSAAEKVASFLLHMVERNARMQGCTSAPEQSKNTIQLPLTRTEISQFLGLRLETVSRQFQQLKSQRVIQTGINKKVTVLDLDRLASLAECAPELEAKSTRRISRS